jgi:hypothetical protein
MVQSSGRFKTTHTGWYPSAKAYEEVRRFETTLYGALFRGQSKKRYLHAHQSVSPMYNPKAKSRGHLLKCLFNTKPFRISEVGYIEWLKFEPNKDRAAWLWGNTALKPVVPKMLFPKMLDKSPAALYTDFP